MDTAQAVALIGFILLAMIVAVAARRASVVLYRTRIAEAYRSATNDLARRVDQSLAEIGAAIDPVRRGEADGDSLRPALAAAQDAAGRYADEARALKVPSATTAAHDGMVAELERAERALALVDHGCALSAGGRRFERGPEAETSIKRGYLNLLHAREAFAERVREAVRAAEDASPARRLGRLRR